MSRRLLTTAAALIGAIAIADIALAQKGAAESPAVLPSGTLSPDSAAAIGAGLRLFPAPGAAAPTVTTPTPPDPPAIRPQGPAAIVKPLGGGPGAGPGLPTAKPAALPHQGAIAPRSPTAFGSDPAVSARVRQQVLAAALPTSPNPQGLRTAVESGAPWQEFDRLLMQHGYDPRDLADVIAAFYLIAWEVTTGSDATTQPAGMAAVRGQARQMLAANPAMSRLSEAERQAAAETLAFHAMAIAARHHDLQVAGGGAALAAFRTEVAQSIAQQQGIDLRRFALTPAGFQAR